jgi:hypothetical protein
LVVQPALDDPAQMIAEITMAVAVLALVARSRLFLTETS